MLKLRAEVRDVHLIHAVDKDDAVGVSHRQTRDAVLSARDGHGPVDHALALERHGHGFGLKRGLSHVDRHEADRAEARVEVQPVHLAAGLDGEIVARHDAVVVQVLAHAADGVAADAAGAAVAVEHAHFRVGHGAALDEHDAVTADAAVTRAQRDAQRFGAGDVPVKILDVDVVIAGGLHF